nr:PREDICTED: pickpocket protein 19-like [Bemisia tabaci]
MKQFYEEQDDTSRQDIDEIFSVLSVVKFGGFDVLETLNHTQEYYSKYSFINLNDILNETRRPCEGMFDENDNNRCWWRNNFFNCCEGFELQQTSHGYCYSFNSDVSAESKKLSLSYGLYDDDNFWVDWREEKRPRRTITDGPWSGLRFTIKTLPIPDGVDAEQGVLVLLDDPSAYNAQNVIFIKEGLSGDIEVWGDAVKTSERLGAVSAEKRNCFFPFETKRMNRGYLQKNCITECCLDHAVEFCNCTPDFMFQPFDEGNVRPACDIMGLICLMKHNVALSNERLKSKSPPMPMEDESILCDCPEDCDEQMYDASLSTSISTGGENTIQVDVHFRSSFCIQYQTDLVFSFMDALISFGNSAGLFLGVSLLGVADILLFFIIRCFRLFRFFRALRVPVKVAVLQVEGHL